MDTIAAISTPIGNGGIGIIRISGNHCLEIIKQIFRTKRTEFLPNTIVFGKIYDDNVFIDNALVSYFKAPNSYTGEDTIEINSHGGMIVIKRILDIVISKGARLAEPGEFTKRAFLNGKMDLSQAESVMDLINSKTTLENKFSARVLKGDLGNKIRSIKENIIDVLVDLEANIDYPEYDIEEITKEKIKTALNSSLLELKNLSISFDEGKIVKSGINVAIVGKPNVGKSSLLNRFLNEERAIVTDIAGTTRDTIEESIVYKGIVLNFVDTAGIHETNDIVEEIGVKRSIDAIKEADVVFMMIDNTKAIDDEDKNLFEIIKAKHKYVLINKIDANDKIDDEIFKNIERNSVFPISAKNNIGINSILDKVLDDFNLCQIQDSNDVVITNIRHKEAIDKTINSFNNVLSVINEMPLDMISIDLQNGISYLGEILGDNVSEDIINGIFKKFCLGK